VTILIEYPADVIRELAALRSQAEQGVAVLAEAEKKHVLLTLEADKIEALAYLEAGGSIPERQAVSKLKALEATEAAELARVEVNRVKLKLKQISEAQMNVQTQARMVELQWKTAGVGER
jgi:hypothetical protein